MGEPGGGVRYYDSYGLLKVFHGGHFRGPPIVYENSQCSEIPVDADRLSVFCILNYVRTMVDNNITLADIYYKSPKDSLEDLTSVGDDDGIRDILEIVKTEETFEVYVDQYRELPGLIDPVLLYRNPNPVLEEINGVGGGGSVNVEGNVIDGIYVNVGNLEGNNVNAPVDLDTESDRDLGTPLNSDCDDEEVLESRRIREQLKEGVNSFQVQPALENQATVTRSKSQATVTRSESQATVTRSESQPVQSASGGRRIKKTAGAREGPTALAAERYVASKMRYKTLDANLESIPERPGRPEEPVASFQEIPGSPPEEVPVDGANADEVGEDSSDRSSYYCESDDPGILADLEIEEEEEVYHIAAEHVTVFETDEYFNPEDPEVVFKCGQRFKSHIEFKEAARRHACHKRADLQHVHNEPLRQRFDCVGECPWTVRASRDNSDNSFRIKRICVVHRYLLISSY